MLKPVSSGVLAALVSCVLVLTSCGGDSSSSPATSEASPPPLAELSALANHYGATEAWFMRMPESQALALMEGDDWSDPGPSPTALVHVVLLKGEYSFPDGKTYEWGLVYEWSSADLDEQGNRFTLSERSAMYKAERPEIPGRSWTPLPLSSPQGSDPRP